MPSIRVTPAAASPGFASTMGQMVAASLGTVDIPEADINIGGRGYGQIIKSASGFDPLTNNDGTFSSLDLGENLYLYAVRNALGIADLVFSKNSTYPDGSSADLSRKIGGLHVGRIRTLSQRYNAGSTLDVGIVPNSVWDLGHRPYCDPSGMVEIVPGYLWMDIYLNSADGAAWPETKGLSEFDAAPVTCASTYARWDFFHLARNAGKLLPTLGHMYVAAYGVPAGNKGGSSPNNTGDHSGYGFECVSCYGIDQPSGNLWQILDDGADDDGSWNNADQGQDSSHDHGDARMRHSLFGGHWAHSQSGARCTVYSDPWGQSGGDGFRGVCPAKGR